jgi:hypothetical protein
MDDRLLRGCDSSLSLSELLELLDADRLELRVGCSGNNPFSKAGVSSIVDDIGAYGRRGFGLCTTVGVAMAEI